MTISYRYFDFHSEDSIRLFDLYEKVWKSESLRKRWHWEYMENPLSDDIKILVAEEGDRIVGYTTRLPFDLKIGKKLHRAYFSVNSMVDPKYKRMGIMKQLYQVAAKSLPLLYSKGSTITMYKLLLNMGYQPIEPNTFLITVLSPVRWILWRLKLASLKNNHTQDVVTPYPNFVEKKFFGDEFDDFWTDVSDSYSAIVSKNSLYMNWRYLKVRHKAYKIFYHTRNGRIFSVLVLSVNKNTANIVDVIWDPSAKDEPDLTIRFAKKYLYRRKVITLNCWGTMGILRKNLKKNFFFDRGETPRFSVYTDTSRIHEFAEGENFHFVHGDSDSEYL